ncbi:MAG: NAD-dependent deacylase [Verrucomicrobiaceae bacterium]|nr:MAG: NAD-dependent deacylase [Verrucomicrobiaceae bacterium]
MKPHLVVASGAGMSAESGLKTFRDHDGLWESFRIEDVATPEAWRSDRALVLRFYNERRKALLQAQPNTGHKIIAAWEKNFRVSVITQNVDDLHERAGSSSILHLHGELTKARSTADPDLVYPIAGWELKEGDRCEKGSQLRPHIVWFGEAVPLMAEAEAIVASADILVIVGTSLQVYPAASLAWCAPDHARKFLIDPRPPAAPGFTVMESGASEGLLRISGLLGGG